LLPKKLAVQANNQNMNVMKTRQAAKEHHIAEEKTNALNLKEKISNATVEIVAKAGTGGRLFGSVTSKEIAEELLKVEKIEIDKRKIILEEPIKAFGNYSVDIKLYPEVVATLKIRVKE
jgi:large subunit ribosomal protein L9